MDTTLLLFQGILALLFLMAGFVKSTQDKEKLAKSLPWIKDYSFQTVRFIGISELLGAFGIIVPALTGNFPVLTPIAAVGLAVIMVLAALHHIRNREYKEAGFNALFLFFLVIVAFYRF